MWTRPFPGTLTVVALVLLVLVPLLASLQYLWLGQLGEQELERMRNNIQVTAFHFSIDFVQECSTLMRALSAGVEGTEDACATATARNLAKWRASSAYPGMVGPIYLITPTSHGVQWKLFSAGAARFIDAPPPADSAAWRTGLLDRAFWSPAETEPGRFLFVRHDLQGFVVPTGPTALPGDGRPPAPQMLACVFQWDSIRVSLLSHLAHRYSPGGDEDYLFTIVERRNPAHVLWSSDPHRAIGASADAAFPLGIFPRFLGRIPDRMPNPGMPRGPWPDVDSLRSGRRPGPDQRPQEESFAELRIAHRAGSLEEVVREIRIRNVAISFSILLLLAGSVVFMVRAAHRTQRLAMQEIEFVAGVSHELRTPLAVLKSVGANLSHGVVADKARIREYGTLIAGEVERLSTMVDNVLEYAGLQSGRRRYEMQRVSPASILASALHDCEGLIQEAGIAVESALDESTPAIQADPAALHIAIKNLLVNAVKYGRDGGWMGVTLCHEHGQIIVTVADHGMGLDPADRETIFEPFHRGRNAAHAHIPGSGLGLSLARQILQAHGGTITARGALGKGATFIVRLPAGDTTPGELDHG